MVIFCAALFRRAGPCVSCREMRNVCSLVTSLHAVHCEPPKRIPVLELSVAGPQIQAVTVQLTFVDRHLLSRLNKERSYSGVPTKCMHEFNATYVCRQRWLRSCITYQRFCRSCGTSRSGSTSEKRLICRTKGDRWVMPLLIPICPCLRQRHVACAVGNTCSLLDWISA